MLLIITVASSPSSLSFIVIITINIPVLIIVKRITPTSSSSSSTATHPSMSLEAFGSMNQYEPRHLQAGESATMPRNQLWCSLTAAAQPP